MHKSKFIIRIYTIYNNIHSHAHTLSQYTSDLSEATADITQEWHKQPPTSAQTLPRSQDWQQQLPTLQHWQGHPPADVTGLTGTTADVTGLTEAAVDVTREPRPMSQHRKEEPPTSQSLNSLVGTLCHTWSGKNPHKTSNYFFLFLIGYQSANVFILQSF